MDGEFFVLRRVQCGHCNGDGMIWVSNNQESCPSCHESGYSMMEVRLSIALAELGIDIDAIQRAQRQARRADDVASMLANGILPD